MARWHEIYFYGVSPYETVYYELIHHSGDCYLGGYDECKYKVIDSGAFRVRDCEHW